MKGKYVRDMLTIGEGTSLSLKLSLANEISEEFKYGAGILGIGYLTQNPRKNGSALLDQLVAKDIINVC